MLVVYNGRPLQNGTFCPISASGSNFNSRNTPCIHPKGIYYDAPVVKIFAFLELEQKLPFFKDLNDRYFHFLKMEYLVRMKMLVKANPVLKNSIIASLDGNRNNFLIMIDNTVKIN